MDQSERFSKDRWRERIKQILEILRKSTKQYDKYAKKVFEDEEAYILNHIRVFLQKLEDKNKVTCKIDRKILYNQIKQKYLLLNELFFPHLKRKEEQVKSIKFKQSYLEKLLKTLSEKGDVISKEVILKNEEMTEIVKNNGKLNKEVDLFVLEYFLKEKDKMENKGQNNKKKTNVKCFELQENLMEGKVTLELSVIIGFFHNEAYKKFGGSIPSILSLKKNVDGLQKSRGKDLEQIRSNKPDLQRFVKSDSEGNARTCYNLFTAALLFNFLNNFVKERTLSEYLKQLSIKENTRICKGIILGNLSSLIYPPAQSTFEEGDSEEEAYEEEVQKITKELFKFFDGYLTEDGFDKNQIKTISQNILTIKTKEKKSLQIILEDHWNL